MFAKQSTARSFLFGPILDSNGVAKTDEVVASIKVTKNGSVGAANGSTTLTHNHTGNYVLAANGGDFDTLGVVEFSLNSGTNTAGVVRFQVVPANVYDSLVAGSDTLQTDLTQIGGTAQRATDLAEIAQYLIAEGVTLTDVIADNSILAQLLAADGDISDYSKTTDALEAIRDRGDGAWITAAGFATAAKLLAYIQLLARSDAAIATDNAAELTEINADEGTGAGDFSNQTEAQEALRDQGDGAWATATGFNTTVPDAAGTAASLVGGLETHGDSAWATATTVALTDGAHGGSAAVLTLKQLVVNNSEGVAVDIDGSTEGVSVIGAGGSGIHASSSGGNGCGLELDGNGTGAGLNAASGASGGATAAVKITSASGHGITVSAAGDGCSIAGVSSGIEITASGGPGLSVAGTATGVQVAASGGIGVDIDGTTGGLTVNASNGNAATFTATGGNGDGLELTRHGTGEDLDADHTAWNTATGFSTHSAADVVSALGTGSTLTSCLTATGFSTHDAAAVVTAFGTGSTLTACLTATGFSTHDAAAVVTAIGSGSTFTAVPWNSSWDAQVQSEVQDAIEVNHLDHLLAATYDPSSKPGAADALLNELVEDDSGVSRFTKNALEQAPSGGGGGGDATAANQTTIITHLTDIKGATWDGDTESLEAIRNRGDSAWATATGFSTLDASGVRTAVGLASANLDTQLSALSGYVDCLPATLDGAAFTAVPWNAAWDAEVQSEVADGLNAYDPPTNTELVALQAHGDSTWATATSVTVSDKTGFKIAADGLDSVTATEPTEKPTTFRGWLMWLVQRFRHATMTKSQTKVLTEAGATVTTQSVSDDDTTQTLGPPS